MLKLSRTKTFWAVFFGVFSAVCLAVTICYVTLASSEVAFTRLSVIDDENVYKISAENTYKQALYTACDGVKNMDANLGKVAVSSNKQSQVAMLTDVVVEANAVNMQLANLPMTYSDNLMSCQKFVNQTQDYATFLIGKLSQGTALTDEQRNALNQLDDVATNVYEFLQDYAESDSGMFITNGTGLDVSALDDYMDELDENSFAYEQLIYDGPFSDSVKQKEIPLGSKVTAKRGGEIVANHFGQNEFLQTVHGDVDVYVYQTENGRVLLTTDGRVLQYESYNEATNQTPPKQADCIAVAEEFCKSLGYDVKGIWVSRTQDVVTYVNCATVIDDTIIYPELIKVAISADGKVVGLEARAYLTNYQSDRKVNFGNISEQDARNSLNDKLVVRNVAKAVIIKDEKEYSCYEYECTQGEREYYVYVDSTTGNEVEIFKVIQNTEGYTVM